jgi:hypothetical protein
VAEARPQWGVFAIDLMGAVEQIYSRSRDGTGRHATIPLNGDFRARRNRHPRSGSAAPRSPDGLPK